jgi:hypothetical protein
VPHTHTHDIISGSAAARSSSGFAGVDHREPKKTLFERTETTEASTTLITHDRSNGPRLIIIIVQFPAAFGLPPPPPQPDDHCIRADASADASRCLAHHFKYMNVAGTDLAL